jgi:hypothetical protein
MKDRESFTSLFDYVKDICTQLCRRHPPLHPSTWTLSWWRSREAGDSVICWDTPGTQLCLDVVQANWKTLLQRRTLLLCQDKVLRNAVRGPGGRPRCGCTRQDPIHVVEKRTSASQTGGCRPVHFSAPAFPLCRWMQTYGHRWIGADGWTQTGGEANICTRLCHPPGLHPRCGLLRRGLRFL